jgi:hypothetical protein
MIQRLQSVYLLLGALCIMSVAFLDDVWQSQAAETQVWFVPALAVLGAVTALAAVGTIFLYKSRGRQVRLIVVIKFMTLAFLALLSGGLFLTGDFAFQGGDAGPAMLLVFALPVAAYILFYFARRGVQRDINLVKSMDRLR